MAQINVLRRIKFCAGHRLLHHEGKCAYFHGHNYLAEIWVTGQEVDDIGRIIDFAHLKRLLKGWIDDHWDHAFLLWEADENGIAAIRSVQPSRVFVLPYNPTAENLARYLLEEVCPPLLTPCGVRAYRVAVWETEESCAEAVAE